MSATLITLFAVSLLGALSMAIYGFRVLVGRWEQPRTRQPGRVAPPPPLGPALPAEPPAPVQVAPAYGPVAVPAPQPAPLLPPMPGPMATPLPAGTPPQVRTAPSPPVPGWAPPPPVHGWAPPPPLAAPGPGAPARSGPQPTSAAAPAFQPRPSRPLAPPLPAPPRLARGSIAPEPLDLLDLDLDDEDAKGAIELPPDEPPPLREPIIERGARFSIIRSSRR